MHKDSPNRKEQQNKLLAYLDQFGKQISNRKGHHGLEQQLSSLSRAYNQAQEKLLETQKALMSQTILLEKQRSIIEIYKQILGQEMEDEGIISFVQNLEQDQDKSDIYDELEQIKVILDRRKRKNLTKNFGQDSVIKHLKEEVSRLEDERNCINDESAMINCEKEELQNKLESLQIEMKGYQQQIETMKKQNYMLTANIQMHQSRFKKQQEDNRLKSQQVQQLKRKLSEKQAAFSELQDIHDLITSKLNLGDSDKQNMKNNSSGSKIHKIPKKVDQLENKLNQLLKYKAQYKKIKENNRDNQFLKQQVLLLKLFVSEQALQIFKQYEQKKLECIEGQLRNLSVLEKNKLLRLEQCQKDIWKYKLQVMKDQETHFLHSSNHQYVTQSLRSQPLSSRLPAHMIESLPPMCETQPLPFSTKEQVSQFIEK